MRMWTAWCVSLCFFGASKGSVNLVLKEDDKATLTCSQNDNHYGMYWYLQQAGKGLQLIYYSTGENQVFDGDFHTGYKAQRPNRSDFSLDISSVKMNYSAVYFCASSVNTALQSHFLSLHKRLLTSTFCQKAAALSTGRGSAGQQSGHKPGVARALEQESLGSAG
uniref:Ig-like domain-containing protein n=1 Tax=Melopsittacus undulatus TaxID=13146 RepID=A0A8V5FQK6_MELUD